MHRISGSWFYALCLFGLVCCLHWQAHSYGFHYDDYHSIVHNTALRDFWNVLSLFTDSTTFSVDPNQAMYRPILLVSYVANYALFGEGAGSFHIFNVILHAVNAVLVFVLMLQLGISNWGSRSVSLVFAIHPLTTETVYYVSSRSESLMALGVLSSLISYLIWSSHKRNWWYLISLAGGTFAVLSKSVGVVFLPLIFLVEVYRSGLNVASAKFKYFAGYLLIVAIYLFQIWASISIAVGQPVRSLTTQVLTQIKVWVYYLFLLVSPYKLSVEHFFLEGKSVEELVVILSLTFLTSIACVVIFIGRRIVKLGLCWSIISLVPASLVPLIVILNEHRLYLSIVGMGIVTVAIWQNFYFQKRKLAVATFTLYSIGFLSISCQQGTVWKNEESLWRNAVQISPKSLKTQLRWADSLAKREDYVEAEQAYLRALLLRPGHPAAGNNLGQLYVEIGEFEKAEEAFRTVIDHDPKILQARLNLAQLFLIRGQWIDAEEHYKEALHLGDSSGVSEKKLGQIALKYRSDPTSAIDFFARALQKNPDVAAWIGYGVSLRAIGRFEQSEASYKEAIKLSPEAGEAWYNLGNLYRDSGRADLAAVAYKKVVNGSNGDLIELAREELARLNDIGR
ncbi:MAG: tetratricopeptide repeat protein [Candidatus Latescibacterota bacterium]|nr:tetratricopeptide repeat protein [Candidatus Latescibacterota bacterium]